MTTLRDFIIDERKIQFLECKDCDTVIHTREELLAHRKKCYGILYPVEE